ncbi:MAG: hypothetical protein PUC47_08765, partial [Oscillospiraceae bacterium]|nr:hypothetical protein [Oscillospiraceae bacterium]
MKWLRRETLPLRGKVKENRSLRSLKNAAGTQHAYLKAELSGSVKFKGGTGSTKLSGVTFIFPQGRFHRPQGDFTFCEA